MSDFPVGGRCEIKLKEDKRWQAAVVQRRLPNNEFEVKRLFDDLVVTVKGSEQLRHIHPGAGLRMDFIRPGLKLQARFALCFFGIEKENPPTE